MSCEPVSTMKIVYTSINSKLVCTFDRMGDNFSILYKYKLISMIYVLPPKYFNLFYPFSHLSNSFKVALDTLQSVQGNCSTILSRCKLYFVVIELIIAEINQLLKLTRTHILHTIF